MEIKIRPALVEDIPALSDRLRKEDADEVLAAGDESTTSALAISLESSAEAFTVELDSIPVAMFGIVKTEAMSARVWFLGCEEMRKIKKSFVRMSRQVIANWLKTYPLLWNVVDCRYKSAVKWLISCGANFSSATVGNPGQPPFYVFVIGRS